MASHKGISKLATSVSELVKVADNQIRILRIYESEMKLLIRLAIEQISQTKIAAAATLARRSPARKPRVTAEDKADIRAAKKVIRMKSRTWTQSQVERALKVK